MSKYPSQMQDKFNLRFPDGMRDAVAERAKKNGRSMNSEIVQIIQDALMFDGIDESTEQFTGFQNDLKGLQSPEDREKYLSALEKEDPFAAALLRENDAHQAKLIRILGEHIEKQNNKRPT
ncbi:Arc family DNA-binding protein [Serratia marcescens]|nr:Arc family DNA-binding protein [Serratia marcescens]